MRRVILSVGLAFQLSWVIACPVLGFIFLGLELDRRLGTPPCLMLIMIPCGLVVAVVSVHRLTRSYRDDQ